MRCNAWWRFLTSGPPRRRGAGSAVAGGFRLCQGFVGQDGGQAGLTGFTGLGKGGGIFPTPPLNPPAGGRGLDCPLVTGGLAGEMPGSQGATSLKHIRMSKSVRQSSLRSAGAHVGMECSRVPGKGVRFSEPKSADFCRKFWHGGTEGIT